MGYLTELSVSILADSQKRGFDAPKPEPLWAEDALEVSHECELGEWNITLALAKLALIHSEVSEALEAVRSGDQELFEEELADIIIRTLHLSAALDIDIEAVVEQKVEHNRTRAYRHGKRA